MIDVEKLLAPLSPDNPCGEDISYAADFLELDSLIRGKTETQFSDAVEPEWKLIQQRCEELSKKSKHLRVITVLCLTALKIDGIEGVAASLELLAKSLRQYWETLYPRLDPEDALDPLERVNILAALASPVGAFGDPFRYAERLAAVPLCNSPLLGRFSFAALQQKGASGENPGQTAQVEAAFRDTSPETLQATLAVIDRSIQAVADIEGFLDTAIGADNSPNVEILTRQLRDMRKAVATFLGEAAPPPLPGAGAANSPGAPSASSSTARGNVTGIQSRGDVINALDLICEYYRKSEPSSPIPLLLRRAQRLVEGDFLAIIDDLAPDSLAQFRTATGVKEVSV